MPGSARWNDDDSLKPQNNERVAQIMANRGVGRRRAYAIAKAELAATINTDDIDQGQRLRVMATLVTDKDSRKDAAALNAALHGDGDGLDMHDTVKTLWALQKQGWVAFRERGRKLYAITIRDEGYEVYGKEVLERKQQQNGHATEEVVEAPPPPKPEPEPRVLAIEQNLIEAIKEAQSIPRERFPLITAILDRAAKAERLNTAARLLEEAGEEDLALQVMGRTKFDPLEKEVIEWHRALTAREEDQP